MNAMSQGGLPKMGRVGSVSKISGLRKDEWVMLDESDPLISLLDKMRAAPAPSLAHLGADRRRSLTLSVINENERGFSFYIMPGTASKSAWDVFVAISLSFAMVMSPLMGAFAPELELSTGGRLFWSVVAVVLNLTFVADILLSMRTAFMEDGVYIRLPSLISPHYLRTRGFLLDVFAALPLRLIVAGSTWRGMELQHFEGGGPLHEYIAFSGLFEFICLWDLWKFNKLMRKLDLVDESLTVHSAVVQLLKLFLGLMYMWLWFGMGYFYIGSEEDRRRREADDFFPGTFSPTNWFASDAPVYHKITRSIFWGISVTATIGPDIEPETLREVLYTTVCSLASIIVYALTIGSASAAIADLQAPLMARQRRLEQLNEYMRYKCVPVQLRSRVNAFFDYRGLSLLGVVSDSDVMNKMPRSLNAELSVTLNRELFSQVPIFEDCPAELLLAMVARLVPLIHMPGDWIIREGTAGRGLFFINRGQCVVVKAIKRKDQQAMREKDSGTSNVGGIMFSRSRKFSQSFKRGKILRRLSSRESTHSVTSTWSRSGLIKTGLPLSAEAQLELAASPVETLAVLNESDFFGERALLTTAGITAASVQALSYCDLMALYASDFQAVVRDFPFFAAVVDAHAQAAMIKKKRQYSRQASFPARDDLERDLKSAEPGHPPLESGELEPALGGASKALAPDGQPLRTAWKTPTTTQRNRTQPKLTFAGGTSETSDER
mmetsp:Transcript_10895/g.27493  ORF Transcript_10895/g.27493 Transcript_10895/m.27493 type:complete len:721 (+) Transcript_10895:63-2225(+)